MGKRKSIGEDGRTGKSESENTVEETAQREMSQKSVKVQNGTACGRRLQIRSDVI